MTQPTIPNTQPSDSEAVTTALETAEALWNRGDPSEALRWLRRAAEAAGDSGDDMRAVALAKAVAELNSSSEKPRVVKPPPLPPKAPPSKAPPAEAEAAPGDKIDTVNETPSKNAQASAAPATQRVSKPPPAPSSRTRASKAPPAPPSKSGPAASKAPLAPSKAPSPSKPQAPKNFARAAVRVYVSTKDQDGDRLEVHVLQAGQRPPAGAIEAMLVPLRKGAKLVV